MNEIRRRRPGFTLVELVIVVLVIGILTAVAVPRYADGLCWHRAETAAERIRADLALAQRRARMASASQTVSFDPVDHAYMIPGVPHLDHPGWEYQVDLQAAPYAASIVSADFGGDAALVFDGYGAPDSGGTVVVQSGKHQKTITVDPETGKATIQ
jgi:prepilin-type N-terminal cleavage/methylation domain-containing protein